MSARPGSRARRRAITTVLGVAWGTFATVALLSFGAGLEVEIADRAHGLGRGILIVWPEKTARPHAGFPEGRSIRMDLRDVDVLTEAVEGLEALSPETYRRANIARSDRLHSAVLCGVTPEYGGLRRMVPAAGGRFLSERDELEARKVAFLGDRISMSLFPSEEAVGQSVVIAGARYLVVGVLESKRQDSDYGGRDSERVCVPASTFRTQMGVRSIDNLVMRPLPGVAPSTLRASVTEHLATAMSFSPEDESALDWWDTTEGDRVRTFAFLAMDVMTGGAGLLTLLVGGLGVAHLAFLRVRARTEEIGLCLALGCTRRRVLASTLGEGVGLTLLGGGLGILAAAAAGRLVAMSPLAASVGSPIISKALAAGVLVVLVLLGAVAAWYPAQKAASVDPVAALGGRT